MQVTAAVCTFNRAQFLNQCLHACAEQKVEFDYEILVVDNNSTDDTKSVVERVKQINPHIQYVIETNQGLSYARNRALSEAKGEIVAFIDDDAIAQPGWLAGIVRPFSEPDVGCVGGKIMLDLPHEVPSWLTPGLYSFFSQFDGGAEVKETNEVYGCNFAVRRSIALELGGFSVNLGFSGRRVLPGEDIEFCRRLKSSGYKIMYTPHAVVVHKVDPSRIEKTWFMERTELQGRASVLTGEVPCNVGEACTTAREIFNGNVSALLNDLAGNKDNAFNWKLHALQMKGRLEELFPRLSTYERLIVRLDYPAAFFAALLQILSRKVKRR